VTPTRLRVIRPLTYDELIAIGCTETEADDYVEETRDAPVVVHLDGMRICWERAE
jgi:hypothetical protein